MRCKMALVEPENAARSLYTSKHMGDACQMVGVNDVVKDRPIERGRFPIEQESGSRNAVCLTSLIVD